MVAIPKLYSYAVTLLSGRKEEFITDSLLTGLTSINVLDKDGKYIGSLTINDNQVESIFYKELTNIEEAPLVEDDCDDFITIITR